MNEQEKALSNRVMILNGFSDAEIMSIMAVVKGLYANVDLEKLHLFVEAAKALPESGQFSAQLLDLIEHTKQLPPVQEVSTRDLIFAKSTPNSLEQPLKDLIIDMSGDHEYLKNNPPDIQSKPGSSEAGSR